MTPRPSLLALALLAGCDAAPQPAPQPALPIREPPAEPDELPPAPVLTPVGPPPADVAVFVPFVPTSIAGLARDDLTLLPEIGNLSARYRDGDRELHLNIARITAPAPGRALYEAQYPEKAASHGVRAHLRHYAEEGRTASEACALLRDVINVCVVVRAAGPRRDALPYLDAIDLPGLVELAAGEGAANGLGDLGFTADEEDWAMITDSLRQTRWDPLIELCKDSPKSPACDDLAVQRADCRPERFDLGLLAGDIELTAKERANFHRLWQINCELAGAPVGRKRP